MKLAQTRDRAAGPAAARGRNDVGVRLRAWRERRRLSQLALALDAGVSARHLSFVETGRARPSPELLLSLAQQMEVPLRERNDLLLAAGYAPRFPQTPLSAPDMGHVRAALQRLLDAHDPYPGVALDREWNLVLANTAAARMAAALPEFLRTPTINMFRASLHPKGFAALTENFDEWGRHLLEELEHLEAATIDSAATALLLEVKAYPNVAKLLRAPNSPHEAARRDVRLLIPCVLRLGGARVSMFTTLATFGSPRDVTLSELTLELFYPADDASAAVLRAMA